MSKTQNALIGFAVGDAMGVPLEFLDRQDLMKNPVTEMLQKKPYPVGIYSDDTSMTVATMAAIIKYKKIDGKHIMDNFVEWVKNGKYSATNRCFGIGKTTLQAITKYVNAKDYITPSRCGLTDIKSNGNGSLMRMLPIALYTYNKKLSDFEIAKITNEVSSLTHAHEISKIACYIYIKYIHFILEGLSIQDAYKKIKELDYYFYKEENLSNFDRILKINIKNLTLDNLNSSGYVVDTLETVFWLLLNTTSYSQTIIGAINLGGDTDTIAAIAGSIAGLVYGYDSIPSKWKNKLAYKDDLLHIAKAFDDAIDNPLIT